VTLAGCEREFADGRQAGLLERVAVEEVVGVEGDEAAVRVDELDAVFLTLRTSKEWAAMNYMMMRKMFS
jgi:hypothetical protein